MSNIDVNNPFKVGDLVLFIKKYSHDQLTGRTLTLGKTYEISDVSPGRVKIVGNVDNSWHVDRFILATPEAIQRHNFSNRLEELLVDSPITPLIASINDKSGGTNV